MKLNNYELDLLKARYPSFELSYESILHNKVPSEYNILLYIPAGKKYIAWFSFYKYKNVLYLMELNKDKIIVNAKIVNCDFDQQLCIGTIFYGTYLDEQNIFIIEDIHYFKGMHLKQITFGERLLYIQDCFNKYMTRCQNKLNFALPIMKRVNEDRIKTIYNTHHLQYRSLERTLPFLNEQATKMIKPMIQTFILYKPIIPDVKKSQYKQKTIFLVRADIQFDIYRLYVYGKNNTSIYYNVAYIPDYKTSVFLNTIFRNIKENRNLDAIEESDDEEEFENVKEDRFVDLQKVVQMECEFHFKFKKWIPKRIVKHQKIVHITQLQFHNEQNKHNSISQQKHKIYQQSNRNRY